MSQASGNFHSSATCLASTASAAEAGTRKVPGAASHPLSVAYSFAKLQLVGLQCIVLGVWLTPTGWFALFLLEALVKMILLLLKTRLGKIHSFWVLNPGSS